MKIAEELQAVMREKGLTLSTAESCTGGAIAASITKIHDASEYFLGSVVSYANEVKIGVLGVPEGLIKEYGAVCPEVATAMWEGVLSAIGSDYAIAVTGIAGPGGGTSEKPVGTVWAVVGKRGEEPVVWNIGASGSREEIIAQTVEAVLAKLLEIVKKTG